MNIIPRAWNTGSADRAPVPDPERWRFTRQFGLWALMATITMLFAGFTSAYLARQAGADWQPIPRPPILWLNTLILLASSGTLVRAVRSQRRGDRQALKKWLFITVCLGILFLLGQVRAWQLLNQQGIFLPTSPHASFFFLLTAVHGLHLVAGLIALVYVTGRAWKELYQPDDVGVRLVATFWHFLDILWIYLFVLIFFLPGS